MAPQQSTPSRSLSSGVQVVTLTVFSTGSAGSTGVPASSGGGGGSGVPIGAIVGGAAAGVILAVALVLLWKYWGLVIKRTDRRKRKEAVCVLHFRFILTRSFICLYIYIYIFFYLSVFFAREMRS